MIEFETETKPYTVRLGDLIALLQKELETYPAATPVYLGAGDLVISRIKDRGSDESPLLQIEFNQVYRVTLDPDARQQD